MNELIIASLLSLFFLNIHLYMCWKEEKRMKEFYKYWYNKNYSFEVARKLLDKEGGFRD